MSDARWTLFLGAARRAALGEARTLGDAVADVVDRVVAGHVLLLQEIGGVALALGEDRHEHVRAGHLVAAGGLDMDHRALDHALEAGRRLRILASVGDQVGELAVDVLDEVAAQNVEIDIAGPHDGGRVLVVDQGEEQVFEGCVFVTALACEREGAVKGLFKTARKARQRLVLYETASRLILFHYTLQRMLVLPGEVHHLRHFGLRNLVSKNSTFPDAVLVDVQHDPRRVLAVLVEEPFQHMHHELHRGVVVVQEQNAVEVGPFRARLGFCDDRRVRATAIVAPGGL